jgi:hypothetical protein
MNRLMKVGLLAFFVALCFGAAIAIHLNQEKPPTLAEHDLYSVVNRQLADLRAADFGSAYQYAASGMQQKFSRMQFELMIRRDFVSMTRAARVEFGAVRITDSSAFAQVFLSTPDGLTRVYLYTFAAENGGWKITGVRPLNLQPLTHLPGVHI